MGLFESIADRRIREARAAGLFDDLPLAGQPIPDLDRQRPAGWWADRVARHERSVTRREELDATVAGAMAALWRLPTEAAVRDRVAELNVEVAEYNRVTIWTRRDELDAEAIVARWSSLGLGGSRA